MIRIDAELWLSDKSDLRNGDPLTGNVTASNLIVSNFYVLGASLIFPILVVYETSSALIHAVSAQETPLKPAKRLIRCLGMSFCSRLGFPLVMLLDLRN